MTPHTPSGGPAPKERFSLLDKAAMRSLLVGILSVGIYALVRNDPFWAVLYSGLALPLGGFLMLRGLCSRCPYPYEKNDCLFIPAGLLTRFLPRRGPVLNRADRFMLAAGGALMVLPPLYWLWKQPAVLTIFLALGLALGATFPLYYCRRCLHRGCPLNKARLQPPGSLEPESGG